MIFLHLEVNILVKKNNQTFGPHTREEIIEFIENGELSPDDLGTLESEENWVPLNNFISSQNPDSESIYDQFEDEDIDYEKLKEWEDVFKDDEDEGDLTEEEAGNTTPNETGSVSSSEQSIYSEANLTDEQGRSYASAPPPLQESEMQTPTAPSDILFPRENEISPNELPDHEESIIQAEAKVDAPQFIPPPPPSDSKNAKQNAKKVSESKTSPSKNRITSSHKIKGLNSNQTVIVVKGEGIISKIYSTSLVFIILCVLVAIITFSGLIFAPERVVPILQNIGIPNDLIESVSPVTEKK